MRSSPICWPRPATGTCSTSGPERHVDGCLRCQAEVAQYRKLLRALRTLRTEVLTPGPGPGRDILLSIEQAGERHAVRSAPPGPQGRLRRRHRRGLGGAPAAPRWCWPRVAACAWPAESTQASSRTSSEEGALTRSLAALVSLVSRLDPIDCGGLHLLRRRGLAARRSKLASAMTLAALPNATARTLTSARISLGAASANLSNSFTEARGRPPSRSSRREARR